MYFISLVFLYFKSICVIFSLVMVSAKLESYFILNEKSYKLKVGYANESILPPYIDHTKENTRLSDLIYLKYKLFVFNLMYMKVLNKDNFMYQSLTIKNILKSFIVYFIGINRFTILLFGMCVNFYKNSNYEDFLLTYFSNTCDHRKLIKINNKWVANNPKSSLKKLLNDLFDCTNSNKNYFESYKNDTVSLSSKIKKLDAETKMYQAPFTDKMSSKKTHKIFLEATNNNLLALETDYTKSVNNNNYNKNPIIVQYDGDKKKSTLLEQNPDEISQTTKEHKVKFLSQLFGAHKYGYDINIISNKYNKSIIGVAEIDKDMDIYLNKYGIQISKEDLFKILDTHTLILLDDF